MNKNKMDPIVAAILFGSSSESGSDIEVEPLSVTENGTYTAASGKAYSPVEVNVPSYPEPAGTVEITENGTYDVKDKAEAVVEIKDWLDQEFTDGKTRFFIELTETEYLSPVINCSLNGKIKIDWGDGTIEEVTDNKSVVGVTYIPHAYNSVGRYIISIELLSGVIKGTYNGTPNNSTGIFTDRIGSFAKTVATHLYMSSLLRSDITYPNLVDGDQEEQYSSSVGMFNNAFHLLKVNIPNGSMRLPDSYFSGAAIRKCDIPNTVAIIGRSTFLNCGALSKIKIPSSVTYIYNNAFSGALSCTVYDFTEFELVDGVLPIAFDLNVFQSIKAGTKILFATEEISNVAKQTTNFVQYASYIHYVGEE